MMRIDLALKYLCLAKSRSSVKALCDNNGLWLNDKRAKPSSTVHVNDEIRIATPTWTLTVSLLSVPDKQLSKTAAAAYYRVIDRERH
jgi:ribosomal 50S subunit-recycling heat shock protein